MTLKALASSNIALAKRHCELSISSINVHERVSALLASLSKRVNFLKYALQIRSGKKTSL